MSKKQQKVRTNINYIEHFFLGYAITGCVSMSFFASLVNITIGITSSGIGSKVYAITAAIEKYKSIIKKRKKKHDEIVLAAKSKLNSIEVLVSKALIGSVISDANKYCAKRYNEMKVEIKNVKT